MKIIKQTIVLLLLLLVSSCATHNGSLNSSFVSEEYVYEDVAFGISQTKHFFYLGGLSKDALILEAKRQLFRSRPLKTNEAYANFSVDVKRTNILFYKQTTVTVSADVVLKNNTSNLNRFSKNYLSKLNPKLKYNYLFENGDTVVDREFNKSIVIEAINDNTFRILNLTQHNTYKSRIQTINNIFSIKKSNENFKIGDSIKYDNNGYKGIIKAIGINAYLYEDKHGILNYQQY